MRGGKRFLFLLIMAKIDRQYLRNLVNGLQDISPEDRSRLLQLINEEKRYGLVWEDKPEEAEQIMKEKLPIIEEVEDKRIINDTAEEKYPNHIIIEGDNLHALTTLCYTHEGKVDVIYIDPPYNTGNKDFKYNDNYVDKEDAYRHSKWLSFMHRRLKLAKRLLSDRGVIFISIDDNEQAQLKLLCDSVLGGGNFVASCPRKTAPSVTTKSNHELQKLNDYILIYVKSDVGFFNRNIIGKKTFPYSDERGDYYLVPLQDNGPHGTRSARPNLYYPIYQTHEGKLILERDIFDTEIKTFLPKQHKGEEGCWMWSKKKFIADNQDLTISDRGVVSIKHYFNPQEDINKYQAYKTWLDEFLNKNGTSTLKEIIPDTTFVYPKPIELILYLLNLAPTQEKDEFLIVLDFFAGSGTTLHATMQLNNEDGGNRQCILVTNNENNICEEVTYERNKRVIQGYTNQKGENVEGLKKNNLRYYKIKAVGREKTLKNKRTLVALSCGMLNIKENIYKEKTTFGSLPLKKNKCRYFSEGEKQMLVIIDEEWIAKIVEQLKTIEVKEPIKVYVFSNSGYAWDDDFFEVKDKVMPCALPEAIYNAYKNILPEREDKIIDTGEEKTLTAEQEEELLKMYEQATREEE